MIKGIDPEKIQKFIDEVDAGNWDAMFSYPFVRFSPEAKGAFGGDVNAAIAWIDIVLGPEYDYTLTRHAATVQPPFETDEVFVGQDRKPSVALFLAALRVCLYLSKRSG